MDVPGEQEGCQSVYLGDGQVEVQVEQVERKATHRSSEESMGGGSIFANYTREKVAREMFAV